MTRPVVQIGGADAGARINRDFSRRPRGPIEPGRRSSWSPFVAALRVVPLAFLLLTSACMLGPDYEPPVVELPESFRAALAESVAGDTADIVEWWRVFEDPLLCRLVEQAFEQNLSLHAAGLRIVQARTGSWNSFWTLFPGVTARASGARSYYSTEVKPDVEVSFPNLTVNPPRKTAPRLKKFLQNFLPSATKDGQLDVGFSDHVDVYSAGLSAIWELDLFGKTRRGIEAADAQIEAAIGLYDAAMVSVAAEVAMTYVQVRTAEARLAIARDHVTALQSVMEMAGRSGGAEAEIDRRLTLAVLRDAEATVHEIERIQREAENSLCVLLGRTPAEAQTLLSEPGRIPSAPVEIALGVPADLLRRRPDIRAAERLAAAQCARIGQARAQAVAPSFTLFGSLGTAASDTSNLFQSSSSTRSYGGGFGWNILLYPILQGVVRGHDAAYEESLVLHRETVLRAVLEVDDRGVSLLEARHRLPLIAESAQASREAFDLAAAGYHDGKVSFPWLMDSIEYRLREEQQEASTRGEVALRMIALYKALGGGWQVRDGKPFVTEEIKERMRERTDWWTFWGSNVLEEEIQD